MNINDTVRVKLTPEGVKIYENHYAPYGGNSPKIEFDGYTSIQLWVLMSIFGPHIGMGFYPPFDTTIEI